MTEDQWVNTTDLGRLLYYASVGLGYDRKIRLFSVACIKRVLCAYNMEVQMLVEAAEQHFDEGTGSIKDLQLMAENEAVSIYQAPFQLARSNRYLGAIGVVNGILADTGWKDHGCLPVFRDMMGNPFRQPVIQATIAVRSLAQRVYATGASAGQLADAISEQLGDDNELSKQLCSTNWHPKGCWVLDTILGKKK